MERILKVELNGVFMFFLFWRYWRFCIMQMSIMITSLGWHFKTVIKNWFSNISSNIGKLLFKHGTRDANQAANKLKLVVWLPWQPAWLPVPRCLKTNISIWNPEGLAWSRQSSHIVKRLLSRFLGVDDS